ncbi:MAG: CPBP family intramembrane glutamic endopeptidase [Elusimicrobiota bacterium]|nr:CPBP family intramembrane glutamic endopeptidase [Elusimicrobiota bacterium]
MRRALAVLSILLAAPAAASVRAVRPVQPVRAVSIPVSNPSVAALAPRGLSAPSPSASLRVSAAVLSIDPLVLPAPSAAPAPAPRAVRAADAPVADAPVAYPAVPAAVRSSPGEPVFAAPADAPRPGQDPRFERASRLVARETAGWSKAAMWTGVGALGLSAVAAAPVAVPAALVAAKGWLAWGGFSALAASTFLKPAADRGAVVPAPPAPATGRFAEYRTALRGALHALAVQKTLEARVGDRDRGAFSTWLLGGLRSGLLVSGIALLTMLAGGAAAKAWSLALPGLKTTAAAAAPAADLSSVATAPFLTQLSAFVAPALVLETVALKVVFDGGCALLRKVLPPGAAAWTAGALAVATTVFAMSFVTTELSVLLPVAGIEAAIVWAYARSGSLWTALAARGLITVLALESARVSVWLNFGAAGALAGLPAWTGMAVAGLLALGLLYAARSGGLKAALAAPGRALGALGEWWRGPSLDGRPKSFWPVMKAGLLWGLVTYAVGDLAYRVVGLVAPAPATEAAPEILAKVLTGPLDLVLFNFVIVGLLEEFVFRRNLFKPMRNWLEKRRLSPRAVFWTAALASSLIFSYVHYIDFGALLADLGIGGGNAVPGAAGAYDWAWTSFTARAAAGVVLAYQYWRSGLLLVPIVAHFASNTMEGLGLRWGVEAFLLMAAGALLLQLVGRSAPAGSGAAGKPS